MDEENRVTQQINDEQMNILDDPVVGREEQTPEIMPKVGGNDETEQEKSLK